MFLAIDIGNSFVKTAVFNNGAITDARRIPYAEFNKETLGGDNYSACAISSVVPARLNIIKDFISSDLLITPAIISAESSFNFNIAYKTKETLGIDRLCGAEGACYLAKLNHPAEKNTYIVSIDFGTATTINIVEPELGFTGGIIAPGIQLMFNSLNKNTSQLPNVTLDSYTDIIGSSTLSSIASGVLNSAKGLIDRVINYLAGIKHASAIKIYITGGNAAAIMPHLDFEFTYEPNLVLYGIYSVHCNMKGKST